MQVFNWILGVIPIGFSALRTLKTSIQESLDSGSFGSPSNQDWTSRILLYAVSASMPALIIKDHLKKEKSRNLRNPTRTRNNRQEDAKEPSLTSPGPLKGQLRTLNLTKYLLEDIISVILTVPIYLTIVRIKPLQAHRDSYTGTKRIYMRNTIKNFSLIPMHLLAVLAKIIIHASGNAQSEDYLSIHDEDGDQDFVYLLEVVVYGSTKFLELLLKGLILLAWLPIKPIGLLSLQECFDAFKTRRRTSSKLFFIFFLWSISWTAYLTIFFLLPFPNIVKRYLECCRLVNCSLEESFIDQGFVQFAAINQAFRANIAYRWRLFLLLFSPNRLIWYARLTYFAHKEAKTDIRTFTRQKILSKRGIELDNEAGDVDEVFEDAVRVVTRLDLEFEETLLAGIDFWVAVRYLGKIMRNYTVPVAWAAISINLELMKELNEGAEGLGIGQRVVQRDIDFLADISDYDFIQSFLMALAVILNPFTGLQLIYSAWKTPRTRFAVDDLCDQIASLYPWIFFDIIGLVLAIVFSVVTVTIIVPKANIRVIQLLFFKTKKKQKKAQNEQEEGSEASGEDPDLHLYLENWPKRELFFSRVWTLVHYNWLQIWNQIRYILSLPVLLHSPKLHAEYRRYRSKRWFNFERIGAAQSAAFWAFWEKIKFLPRAVITRVSQEDTKLLGKLLELVEAGVWTERHQTWFRYNNEGKIEEKPKKEKKDDKEKRGDKKDEKGGEGGEKEVKEADKVEDKKDKEPFFAEKPEISDFEKSFRASPEGVFEDKLIREVYFNQNRTHGRFLSLLRFEKWTVRLGFKVEPKIPKIDQKKTKEAKEVPESIEESAENPETENKLTKPPKIEKIPERENLQKWLQNEASLEDQASYYFEILKQRRIAASQGLQDLRNFIFKKIIFLISMTLLWRALDMKKYFNIAFILNLLDWNKRNPKKKKSIFGQFFKIYFLCYKNLLLDIAYWWVVCLILRQDKGCFDLCFRKIAELEKDRNPARIPSQNPQTTTEGTENPENAAETQEVPEIDENFTNLINLENIKIHNKRKRALIWRYSGYSLNDLIDSLMEYISLIFLERREFINTIQSLKRMPQFANTDSRTTNLMILNLLAKDALAFTLLAVSFTINPLRIYSFYLYCKRGQFVSKLNPEIDVNGFQSFEAIRFAANTRFRTFFESIVAVLKGDLKLVFKFLVVCMFPIRLISLSGIFFQVRHKLRKKKRRDDTVFNDVDFLEKIDEKMNEVLAEVKKDFSSMLSVFVIIIGVYEIIPTWRRVKIIINFMIKQSPIYQFYKRSRTMDAADWARAIGLEVLCKKIGFDLFKNRETGKKEEYHNRVLFERIGWQNMIELGDFMTVRDRMQLCLVNKNTRRFYMQNSVLWLNYYKKNIQANVVEIESFSSISYKCLAHYRKLMAEKNSAKERDFNLGLRYILKEQAIRSIISFPDLISSPYKAVAVISDKLGIEFQPPHAFVNEQRTEANNHYTAVDQVGGGVPEVAVFNNGRRRRNCQCLPAFPATFREGFATATGTPTEEMKAVDRIRGFLILEKLFYKLVLLIGGIHAYFRSIFFYRIVLTPEEGSNEFWHYFVNSAKSTLQLVYVAIVGFGLYKYLRLLMALGFDFITAMLGPFCLHILIGFHIVREVRNNPVLHKEDLDLRKIMLSYKGFLKSIASFTITPVIRFMYNLVTGFFFRTMIPKIGRGLVNLLKIYEATLVVPTQAMISKGTLLEVLHLVVVLVWVLWPQAFIWGYFKVNIELPKELANYAFGVALGKSLAIWQLICNLGWLVALVAKAKWAVFWVYRYAGIKWTAGFLVNFYSFSKRIWVLGWLIRLFEWISLSLVVGNLRWLTGLIWVNLSLVMMEVAGVEREGTGGSFWPKLMLSLILLALKIIRAITIIKEVGKERM